MHPKPLTIDQTQTLREAFDALKHPYPIAFDLMLEAGLRVAEVCSLCWLDVMHLGNVKECLTLDASAAKNGRERIIPITARLSSRITQAWNGNAAGEPPVAAGYVAAARPHSKAVSPRSLERNIKRLASETLGIDVNPHMLRHTFATRLLRTSNLEIVRAALGHKRVSTTQIYVHTSIDDLAEAMKRAN